MSISFSCKCGERKKPVIQRAWEIIDYKCNYTSFNGGHYTPSAYSCVHCLECRACGRTKAAYVDELADAGKFNITCKEHPEHEQYMARIRKEIKEAGL